ncbi:hypothetical protein FRC03_011172 [Tulasnella sp. 419]|nr:hypothetical protein FRC02_004431 [Tulasnella sp. 418]KAG8970154.1 hypothetical protein FRC03_011172 [Tulasnella sp. 419]
MGVLSIFNRHPRFAIACGIGLLVVILLQTTGPVDRLNELERLYKYPPSLHSSGDDGAIKLRLQDSEEHYQEVLKQRANLIKQYGPWKEDILPWPKNREFYTLWDFFTPAFNCPHEVKRIGLLGDGGKWVCGLSKIARKKDCVIYSFGINDESSFEAALLEKTEHCQVYGYDFSVRDFGPEIRDFAKLRRRSHFKPWGLQGKDDPDGNPPMYSLQSLMKLNGHTFIDLLKIDIEGYEFPALRAIMEAYKGKPLPFGQLQLEIHADRQPGVTDDKKRFSEFLKWWEELEDAGLRPFWTEPNLVFVNINLGTPPALAEYSFINIRGDHDLLH